MIPGNGIPERASPGATRVAQPVKFFVVVVVVDRSTSRFPSSRAVPHHIDYDDDYHNDNDTDPYSACDEDNHVSSVRGEASLATTH